MVDTLLNAQTTGSQKALAFYYCNRNDPGTCTPEAILRAILKQLSSLNPDSGLLNSIVKMYIEVEKAGHTSEPLNLDQCHKLIIELLSSYSQINIIIDSLDECHKETRSRLISALLAIMDSAPGVNLVKIFISSRDDDDIVLKLRGHPHIRINSQDNSKDIEKFVTSEITSRIKHNDLLRGDVSLEL